MSHTCLCLNRREFLATLSAAAIAGPRAPALLAKDADAKKEPPRRPQRRPETFTYKTVDGLPIQADVYRGSGAGPQPVLLWIHGGALIMGNRGGVDGRINEPFLNAGYTVVSIDYRLAPESKLPQILDDLRDAYTWLHDKGPDLFHVDTQRIAVAGGSAGGYLSLMSGFCVTPRPAVLVSLWGYGDPTADWESRPSDVYRRQPLVSKADALAGVGTRPLADGFTGGRKRGRFYLYCRQQGLWPQEVVGLDPRTEDRQFNPYCPVRNVTKDFPPTLFIHGTADSDVPHEQSVQMNQELARNGVDHQLISIPKAGHGVGNGDRKTVAAAFAAAISFVDRHVRPQSAPRN